MHSCILIALLGALALAEAGSSSYYTAPYAPHVAVTAPVTRPVSGNAPACPPTGYHAISATGNLNLPAYGKYAICAPSVDTSPDTTFDVVDFNVTRGVFRLVESELVMDDRIRINVVYPARVEFLNSVLNNLPNWEGSTDVGQGGPGYQAAWAGIQVIGAPPPPPLPHHVVRGGSNCGKMDNVALDGFNDPFFSGTDDNRNRATAVTFINCDDHTEINQVTIFNAYLGMSFTDCTDMILEDVRVYAGYAGVSGILASNSHVSFIRPVVTIYQEEGSGNVAILDAFFSFRFLAESTSTLCFPFANTNEKAAYQSSGNDLTAVVGVGGGSTVSIAGVTNIDKSEYRFGSGGGLIHTMKSCPSTLSRSYPMHSWVSFETSGDTF